jgi:hypothetical protein
MKDVVFGVSRRVPLLLALLVSVLAAGCSGKPKEAKDSVSGKVTLGEQPVSGTIALVYPDKPELSAPINDGNYRFDNPPAGKVKILIRATGGPTVTVGVPGQSGTGLGPAPAQQGVAPPLKYSQVNSSPLEYDIQPGKHTHDIKLTP